MCVSAQALATATMHRTTNSRARLRPRDVRAPRSTTAVANRLKPLARIAITQTARRPGSSSAAFWRVRFASAREISAQASAPMLSAAASQPATARRAPPSRAGTRKRDRDADAERDQQAGARLPRIVTRERAGRSEPSAASFADRPGGVKPSGEPILRDGHVLATRTRRERRRRRRGQLSRSGRRAGARCRCGSSIPAGAPRAELAMTRDDDGVFTARADAGVASAGDDYAYLLPDVGARPDPVSRHQPRGVHAPSRIVAADAASPGPTPAGAACRAPTSSSTSCTSARSRPKGRSRASPRGCRTCATSASPPSS